MSIASQRLVVVNVAGLGWDLVNTAPDLCARHGFSFQPMETVFPALTCPVQASFRTASHPSAHGVMANGFYARRLARSFFWEQSAGLVHGRRIWSRLRAASGQVGLMFWQQSLGEDADMLLSPRPIHTHHGRMIPDCQSKPDGFYASLRTIVGRPFPLDAYWGPRASLRSSQWIADATCAVLSDPDTAPDLLLVYLPHLDYALQRAGPGSPEALRALDDTLGLLAAIWSAAREIDADVLAFGDYAIAAVDGPPICPALELRRHGLFAVRNVRGRLYPDFFSSRAVALADHEIALVYTRSEAETRAARRVFENLDGVELVLDAEVQRDVGVSQSMGPDLILVAAKGRWFAYPWWERPAEAPDFADHVDIHAKPGYDPCELFPGRWPGRIDTSASRVRGTHGRAGADRMVAWASTLTLAPLPRHLLALARAVEDAMAGPGPA